MWDFALKSVRSRCLFAKPIFAQENGLWTVNLSEGVELLKTSWFFQPEATFVRAKRKSPGDMLPQNGSAEQYVKKIAVFVFRLGKGKSTNSCLPYEFLVKHG